PCTRCGGSGRSGGSIDLPAPGSLEYAFAASASFSPVREIALLFFPLLVFLAPLAIYCLVLAMLNRRPLPVMVRGVWDCVGLIFAASGFLLVVAPTLINRLYANALGNQPLDSGEFYEIWLEYWILTLLYYVVVSVGIVVLLWSRSTKTVIYNVDA